MYTKSLVSLLVAAALMTGACGDDESTEGRAGANVPAAGEDSPVFGLPLPKGSVAEAAPAGGEAFRVPNDADISDVTHFYAKEIDGRPLRGRDWCGAAVYDPGHIVRVWQSAPGDGHVVLDLITSDQGVLVTVREDPAAAPGPCPPEAPGGDQPFESPEL